jgi:trk/ktr system potassium uptake protein
MGTYEAELSPPVPARQIGSGALPIMAGFTAVIALGTLLLSLPISTAGAGATSPFDALFTVVSAICTAGLVVFDTQEHWTFFGELVILAVIQIGGLGFMAGTTLILWILGRQLGLRHQHMLRLYYGAPSIAQAVRFTRIIALYAVGVEVVGAAALFFGFWLSGTPASTSIWWATFHSVSAFNLAGFNVTGADMVPFAGNLRVLLPLAALGILGSVGAIPVVLAHQRTSIRRLPLDTKLIFLTTAALLLVATAVVLLSEWSNALTIGAMSIPMRPLIAFFEASMWTTGFSAIDIGGLTDETKLFLVAVMFIGGAAGSAAGGIKVGVFSILLFAMLAALRGQEDTHALGYRVQPFVIRQALTIALLFVAVVFAVAVLLMAGSEFAAIDVLVEASSAVAGVGWSAGITAGFSTWGRVVLIVGMLAGRFGPLLLVLRMVQSREQSVFRHPEEAIRLG